MGFCNHPARFWTNKHGRPSRCVICAYENENAKGSRKAQPKREGRIPMLESTKYAGRRLDGTIADVGDLAQALRKLGEDPIRLAAVASDYRRPIGVSSTRYNIAIRAAGRHPMLNADPKRVTKTLGEAPVKSRLPKHRVVKRLVVKPTTGKTGRAGWQERLWTVHDLRYAKGFVIVTDEGDESKVFPTLGELSSAIKASGWEIVR